MERWEGKVAIVTGASSGIGAAVAKMLVQKGLKVIGLAHRVDLIEELACSLADQPGVLFALACDVSNETNILECFEWVSKNVGPVHILINNAGVAHPNNLIDGPTEEWRHVFDVNVLGLLICTREAIKIMKENGIKGHIVKVNSISGHRVYDVKGLNVYGATKFAVTSLTETLRFELNREKCRIKVTSISPGVTTTEFLVRNNLDKEVEVAFLNSPQLTSEDVADAIVYILSTPPSVAISELTIKPLGEAL